MRPSNQEMTILSLLWERGGMTARQVLEAMPDGKQRAYTSVLSVLQAMERKGFVNHTSVGGANVYAATVAQSDTLRPVLRDLVRNLFGGSPATAMQQLLANVEVSDDELNAIQSVIEAHRNQQGGDKSC